MLPASKGFSENWQVLSGAQVICIRPAEDMGKKAIILTVSSLHVAERPTPTLFRKVIEWSLYVLVCTKLHALLNVFVSLQFYKLLFCQDSPLQEHVALFVFHGA